MAWTINKRRLHHAVVTLRHLRVWQLIVIVVIMLFVTATLLRLNNLGMIDRRTAVEAADKKGDPTELHAALVELQHYVSQHMNTSLDKGVYLQESYNRARAAALDAAANVTNPNSAIYQQASLECRSRFVGGVQSFRNDYVQCVVDRVGSLSPGVDPVSQLKLPKSELFRYDFVSPLWTPDVAGFAVLVTAVIAVILALRIVLVLIARWLLSRRAHRV